MVTTTRSDIPGYDVVRQLDDLRNPVFEVRRMPSEDIFVAKVVGPEFEPFLPGQRSKAARRMSRVLSATVGWVPVEDHGTTSDGQSFVVMPMYGRGSLAEHLDSTAGQWADVVRWTTGAALSVGKLHDEGVSLGQLRPSAILLSDDDEPHVAVYGMASRRFDDGTFRFEAPEVVSGDKPTPASDTYSLALILTTVLIGRTPEFGESLADYVAQLDDTCPAAVKAVIAKSLAEDPSARHSDGTDFAHSLRASAQDSSDNVHLLATVTTQLGEPEAPEDLGSARSSASPTPTAEPVTGSSGNGRSAAGSEPYTAAEGTADNGPLNDLMWLASVTAPLPDTAARNEAVDEPPTTTALASSTPGAPIAAKDMLGELEELVWNAPDTPPSEALIPTESPPAPQDLADDCPADDNSADIDPDVADPEDADSNRDVSAVGVAPVDGSTTATKIQSKTADDKPAESNDQAVEPESAAASQSQTTKGGTNPSTGQGGDGVPFSPRPAGRSDKLGSPAADRFQNVALRAENLWYANRRSVASVIAAAAVLGIAAIAAALAYQSYQDERAVVVEGAPAPTTEQVVVADLNNEIAFVTEPPQTNTTTTTAPPRRRTTTTTAAPTKTTADGDTKDNGDTGRGDDDKPADDPPPDDDEEEDDEDSPDTTRPPATIPPDVEEEQEERRGRGRRP